MSENNDELTISSILETMKIKKKKVIEILQDKARLESEISILMKSIDQHNKDKVLSSDAIKDLVPFIKGIRFMNFFDDEGNERDDKSVFISIENEIIKIRKYNREKNGHGYQILEIVSDSYYSHILFYSLDDEVKTIDGSFSLLEEYFEHVIKENKQIEQISLPRFIFMIIELVRLCLYHYFHLTPKIMITMPERKVDFSKVMGEGTLQSLL